MADSAWPDAATSAALHARLLAGDPIATSDFANAFYRPLVAYLRAHDPRVDDHLRLHAAGEAVFELVQKPSRFDPARGELGAFLRVAAQRDLLNLLRREQKHRTRRESLDSDSVEFAAAGGNNSTAGGESDLPSFDDPGLAAVIAGFTDAERRVLDLMRAGERATEAFAAALGILDRSPEEQAAEVKRVKDRIKQRLKRAGGT